jgi:uncharacterized membrane protein
MVAVVSGSVSRRAVWTGRRAVVAFLVVTWLGPLGVPFNASGQGVGPAPGGSSVAREGRRLIETIRIWKMTEALNLSEEQAARLFPKLSQLEATRREFRQRQHVLRGELAELLRQQPLREAEIKKKLEDLERAEVDFRGRERAMKAELESILSLEQQARLALFVEQFEAELRRTIHDLRLRRRAMPGGQGVGPPGVRGRSPLPVEGGPPPR